MRHLCQSECALSRGSIRIRDTFFGATNSQNMPTKRPKPRTRWREKSCNLIAVAKRRHRPCHKLAPLSRQNAGSRGVSVAQKCLTSRRGGGRQGQFLGQSDRL